MPAATTATRSPATAGLVGGRRQDGPLYAVAPPGARPPVSRAISFSPPAPHGPHMPRYDDRVTIVNLSLRGLGGATRMQPSENFDRSGTGPGGSPPQRKSWLQRLQLPVTLVSVAVAVVAI